WKKLSFDRTSKVDPLRRYLALKKGLLERLLIGCVKDTPSKEVKDGLRLYECLGQGLRYLCSRHTFEPLIKSLSLILQKELEEYQRTKTTEEAPSVGLVNILAAYTFVIQSCRVDKVLSVADTLVKV